jgi:hypothetical protein
MKHIHFALFLAAVIGFGAIAQFAVSNIYVQAESVPEMRGRVIGITLMAIFGMMPLGACWWAQFPNGWARRRRC